MRILMISTMFPKPHQTFNGISIYQTAKRLREKGFEFLIIDPVQTSIFPFNIYNKWKNRSPRMPLSWIFDGFHINYLRYVQLPKVSLYPFVGDFLWFSTKSRLKKLAVDFKPDLIWAQPALPCGWAAMKLAKSMDLPYIIIVHGVDINEGIYHPQARPKIAMIYTKADKVMAVSEKLKRGVLEVSLKADCVVIHNGIDYDFIKKSIDKTKNGEKKNNNNGEFIVISISNLKKSKGIEYNLHALNALIDKYPSLKYKIIGDGPHRELLKAKVKELDLEDSVWFIGQMDYDQAMAELSQSNIFSLPSYREGFGLVYLEAMALGIPVIGCMGEGPEDFIENEINGFLVEPENPHELASVWEKLIQNSNLRHTVGESGRKTVLKNFTWDKIIDKYENVFNEMNNDE